MTDTLWQGPVQRSDEYGVSFERFTTDGRVVQLVQELFSVKMGIGPAGAMHYTDHWDYDTMTHALLALAEWEPATEAEPQGWHRNLRTGRRRPDGDASREYVAP